ncbi:MAG: GGDEF domain-containing protein [Lachnospiraceae bacterium]|nr:GGDEF domain-containing protein [Lachnospiraceae bacterium]
MLGEIRKQIDSNQELLESIATIIEGIELYRMINDKQESIDKDVRNVTMIVNTILLICHIMFCFFFGKNNVNIMYQYNFISIIVYLLGFWVLRDKLGVVYVSMVYVELLIFMILAVICLGWEYGFQQYCIGFITTALFTDFYTSHNHKLKKRTIMVMAMYVIMYIVMRIWTYEIEPLNVIDNKVIEHALFIANTLISFGFLVVYSCFYSNTVFKLEKMLTDVASIDALTGLFNRRKMQELMRTAFDERLKDPCKMCVAMIDVDDFKQINDRYGHDVGDKALKALADILIGINREKKNFHVSRWGGEEFLVLYRHYDKDEEGIMAEFNELRKKVENNLIVCGNNQVRCTITIGVAFCDKNSSMTDMIKEADGKLYKGKENGKNVVV